MKESVKKGIYLHFKGEYYEVIGEGSDSETEIPIVIYQHMNSKKIWIRPRSTFLDTVDHNGKKQIRFKFIR